MATIYTLFCILSKIGIDDGIPGPTVAPSGQK